MYLSEEQVYQYAERPEEDIVDPVIHGKLFFVRPLVRDVLVDLLLLLLLLLLACRFRHDGVGMTLTACEVRA